MAPILQIYILCWLYFMDCFDSAKIYDSRGPHDWEFWGCYSESVTSFQCDLTQSNPTTCAAVCGWDSYIEIPSNGYISTIGYRDITVTFTLKASNMYGITNGDDHDRCQLNYIYPSITEWQYLDNVQDDFYRFNQTMELPNIVDNNAVSFNIQSFSSDSNQNGWCYFKYI